MAAKELEIKRIADLADKAKADLAAAEKKRPQANDDIWVEQFSKQEAKVSRMEQRAKDAEWQAERYRAEREMMPCPSRLAGAK